MKRVIAGIFILSLIIISFPSSAVANISMEEAEKIFQEGISAYYDAKNYNKAFECYYKAAEAGHVEAQAQLGFMYWAGFGVRKNYDEAIKWSQIAADAGDAFGIFNMGCFYDFGHGVPRDRPKAIEYMKRAARMEGPGAPEYARNWLRRIGITDWSDPFIKYIDLAKSGSGREIREFIAREKPDLTYKDKDGWTLLMFAAAYNPDDSAVAAFLRGSEINGRNNQGETALALAAMMNTNAEVLTRLLWENPDVNAIDNGGKTPLTLAYEKNRPKEFTDALERAGGKGEKPAPIVVAEAPAPIVPVPVPQAESSPQQAPTPAAAQSATASLPTGDLRTLLTEARAAYAAKDYAKAFPYFYAAAEEGHADAQYHVGLMYRFGQSVAEDYSEALDWFFKAADQNYAPAAYSLGEMHEVYNRDLVIAIYFYEAAAGLGSDDAKAALARLGKPLHTTAAEPSYSPPSNEVFVSGPEFILQ